MGKLKKWLILTDFGLKCTKVDLKALKYTSAKSTLNPQFRWKIPIYDPKNSYEMQIYRGQKLVVLLNCKNIVTPFLSS